MNPEGGVAIEVVGKEIGALPVVGEFDAVETVVGQPSSQLLEVLDFLLATFEGGWIDALERVAS